MDHPVLIVGAGPTGLTLALLLRRFGVSVRIVDLKPTLHRESRSLALHPSTLEMFGSINIAQKAIDAGQKVQKVNLYFNKKKRVTFNFSSLKTLYPFILILPQYKTEQILIEQLNEYGTQVERNTQCIGLKAEGNHYWATLKNQHEQKEITKMSWVIGCDGMHGGIKNHIGAQYKEFQQPMTFSLADVELETDLATGEINSFIGKEGAQFFIPIENKTYRIISQRKNEDLFEPTTSQKLQEMIAQRSASHAKIFDLNWIKDLKIHHKIATQFRNGRAFLAGDAAHVHSPVGGQGMNMGIQDAFNLGWKLAYVIRYGASTKLLASYSRERIPVAKQMTKNHASLASLMSSKNSLFISYFGMVMKVIQKVSIFHFMIVYQFSGLSQYYKNSPIIKRQARFFLHKPSIAAGARFFNGELIHAQTREVKNTHQIIAGNEHHLFIFFKVNYLDQVQSLKNDIDALDIKDLQLHLVSTDEQLDGPNCWIDRNLYNSKPYQLGKNFMVIVRPDQVIGLTKKNFSKEAIATYFDNLYNSVTSES